MSRPVSINGTGTKFYGISLPDAEGKSTATLWVTFLFLPLVPLKRVTIKRQLTDPRRFVYTEVARENFSTKEILMTYLFGWIITPLAWFGPLVLCIREVASAIGIPTEGDSTPLWTGMIVFAILWLIVFTWKWKDWLDKQGLPSDYKQLLKMKS